MGVFGTDILTVRKLRFTKPDLNIGQKKSKTTKREKKLRKEKKAQGWKVLEMLECELKIKWSPFEITH
jgi:G:T-mismatch repair DNA endonuclease (very short patch repair protein)